MTTRTPATLRRPDDPVEAAARRPRRGAVVAVVIVVLAVAVAWDPMGLGQSESDASAEQAASFLAGFDAVSAELAAARQTVAARAVEDRDPDRYADLAAAIDDARAGYGLLDPPPAIAGDLDALVTSLGTELQATDRVREALAAGDDAEAALRHLLDRRTEAENLQRAVRRTAGALAAGV